MRSAINAMTATVLLILGSCGPSVETTDAPSRQGSSKTNSSKKVSGDALGQDSETGEDTDGEDSNKENLDNSIVQANPVPQAVAASSAVNGVSGSGGIGGSTGPVEVQFTASNGKSSKYKTNIPTDVNSRSQTYGLSIHLHGDGGGDYDWLYEPNVRIAKKHELIGIVVLAPNTEKRWYNDGVANAQFLDELIQNEILKKYNIDRDRIYFSGVSGGSQFLTGQFIPKYGSKYNSGAVLLCGGPKNWLGAISSTTEFISKFKLYWYSGTGDFLYDQIVAGIAYYKGLGLQVDSEIIEGATHCKFPGGVSGALDAKLPSVLR